MAQRAYITAKNVTHHDMQIRQITKQKKKKNIYTYIIEPSSSSQSRCQRHEKKTKKDNKMSLNGVKQRRDKTRSAEHVYMYAFFGGR